MNAPSMEQSRIHEISVSTRDQREPYCPEYGQSLDLARHQDAPAKRRTLGPIVFLVFGLCLTIAFGLRAGNTHTQLSRLDQQIAALRVRSAQSTLPKPGNQAIGIADMLAELLNEPAALQVGFHRELTGLGLGLLTVVVGATCSLGERPEVWDRWRKRSGLASLPSSSQWAGVSLLYLGDFIAKTLVRMLLIEVVVLVRLQLNLGVPPPFELVDHVLTRLIILIDMAAKVLL